MAPPLVRLDNPIRNYAWGSRTAIAALQGRPTPTAAPEAELWIGAHPSAPSRRADDGIPLPELIAAAPDAILGAATVAVHGPHLPFLLKVLAADQPLSIQAHPSAEQAAAGFAAEEAAGVPVDAPERVYRDPWPKPELLCALTPFDTLCGFRPAAATLDLLDALAVEALAPVAAALRRDGDAALAAVVRDLLTLPTERRGPLVDDLAAAARDLAGAGGDFAAEAAWTVELADRYPGDPGVAVALLLHLVRLGPGDAIHLPAGNLHAYLRGVGVEIMATSDNVLRGGLTEKHVDVDGLLHVLDASTGPPPRIAPRPGAAAGEVVYPTPTPQFRLSRIVLDGGTVTLDRRGVEVLLCTDGEVAVTAGEAREARVAGESGEAGGAGDRLGPGDAVLVTAEGSEAGEVALVGAGTVFRATTGDPD